MDEQKAPNRVTPVLHISLEIFWVRNSLPKIYELCSQNSLEAEMIYCRKVAGKVVGKVVGGNSPERKKTEGLVGVPTGLPFLSRRRSPSGPRLEATTPATPKPPAGPTDLASSLPSSPSLPVADSDLPCRDCQGLKPSAPDDTKPPGDTNPRHFFPSLPDLSCSDANRLKAR